MSIQEMKEEIINKIKDIEDEDLVIQFYDIFKAAEKDPYPLSEAQMQRVEESLAEYEKGNFTYQEDLEKEIDKWLEE